MLKRTSKIVTFLLCMVLAYSCTESEDHPTIQQETAIDTSNPVVQYIVSEGFALEDIRETREFFIAEGDILFAKDMKLPDDSGPQTETHYRRSSLISGSIDKITIYVNKTSFESPSNPMFADVSSKILFAVDKAINAYNNDLDLHFKFERVSSSRGANIRIELRGEPTDDDYASQDMGGETGPQRVVCGAGSWPSFGNPGELIRIWPIEDYTTDQLTELVVHEMGHNIGMTHTDKRNEGFIQIGNITPGSDPASVMISEACGKSWNGFSSRDVEAFECLYKDPNRRCDQRGGGGAIGVLVPCEIPPKPINLQTYWDMDGNLRATISRDLTGVTDEYEWTTVNGFIVSGQGSRAIKVVPQRSCHSTSTLTVSVKAVNRSPYCVSDAVSASRTYRSTCKGIF